MNKNLGKAARARRRRPRLAATRPPEGWLKAMRSKTGLSLQAIADRLGVSPQAIHQLEKSELAETISLQQLVNVAEAMGYEVVYSLRRRAQAASASSERTERVAAADGATPLRGPVSSADNAAAPSVVSLDRFSVLTD